mmetsp:Transcript_99996/g.214232  ORF Transcript_99996/g.214232 Transcript_99996/m.214232 type:complete len:544 (-) Transcript_99996:129-1760(-)
MPPHDAHEVCILKGLTGERLCKLSLEGGSWTVHELKRRLAELEGIPAVQQQLFLPQARHTHLGGVLRDGDELPRSPAKCLEVSMLRVTPEPNAELLHNLRRGRVRLVNLPETLCDHFEVVLQAGLFSPSDLCHASDRLRADKELLLAVLRSGSRAVAGQPVMAHVAPDLRSDRQVAMAAVYCGGGHELGFVSTSLREDLALVMLAVRQDGSSLQYASDQLRRDRRVVLASVQQEASALRFAASELKQDPEILLTALGQSDLVEDMDCSVRRGDCRNLLYYAPEILRMDKDVVMAVVRLDGLTLEHASPELRCDQKIALAAVGQNPAAARYIDSKLLHDRTFALRVVAQNWPALVHLPMEMRSDPGIVHKALQQDWRALELASPDIRRDPEIVLAFVEERVEGFQCEGKEHKRLCDDRTFLLEAAQWDGRALRYASASLRKDRLFVREAVCRNPAALWHAAPEWHLDQELAAKACWLGCGQLCKRGVQFVGSGMAVSALVVGAVAFAQFQGVGVLLLICSGCATHVVSKIGGGCADCCGCFASD